MVSAWLIPPLALLTGWFTWSRLPSAPNESDDPLERIFASILCAVTLTGFLAFLLAELSVFSAWLLATVLAAASLALWLRPLRTGATATIRRRDVAAVCLMVALAAATVAPASEDLLGGRDPGVYANFSSWLARKGTIRFHSESLTTVTEQTRPAFHSPRVFIPGLHIRDATRGELSPQFFHLHPVYMALGFWMGGPSGALLVPPLFGVLAELAVFFFVRRVLGVGPALVAGGLLALNLAQIWVVRNPYSEGVTQLGVFGALWCLARGYETGGMRWGVLGGLSLGVCLLARVDSALLITALMPALVLLQASSAHEQRWAYRVFLPITIVMAAWALIHGRLFAHVYMRGLSRHLWPLWGTNLAVILLGSSALIARGRMKSLLDRVYRRGRWLWAVIAVALCVVFIVGMWVRPHMEPFEMLRGGRIRRYNEEMLARVAWYVSIQGMVAGLAGVVLVLREWLVRRRAEWVPFVMVLLAFSFMYFWNHRAHPDHPWAMRRFMPVVVPGICVAIAAAASWLWARQDRWRFITRIVAICGVASIASHEAAMARPFWAHREYSGVVSQLEAFANDIPEDSLVLFSYRGTEQRVALPLTLVWGRSVLAVTRSVLEDPDGEKRRPLFEAQVRDWLRQGRDVLYIAAQDGHSVFLTHELHWEPVATLRLEGPTIGMHYTNPPRRPLPYAEPFHLFRAVMGRGDQLLPCAPVALRVGRLLAPGTAQGLYGAENRGRFRWTMPNSRLLFPRCDRTGAGRPHVVRVRAACGSSLPDYRCRVDVAVDGARAGTLALTREFADVDLPVPQTALAQGTGPVEIRFQGPRDERASRYPNDRSFLLANVSLLGASGSERRRMRHLFRAEVRPPDLNLITDEAEVEWGVAQEGFYGTERGFRWTQRRAALVIPIDGRPPDAIRVKFLRSSRPTNRVRFSANGCSLFDGTLPRRDWETTFSLESCPTIGDELRISIESDVTRPPKDARELGVAVRQILVEHK